MAELQVRRMPVLSRSKRLVGVISITDLALNGGEAHTGRRSAGTGTLREDVPRRTWVQ